MLVVPCRWVDALRQHSFAAQLGVQAEGSQLPTAVALSPKKKSILQLQREYSLANLQDFIKGLLANALVPRALEVGRPTCLRMSAKQHVEGSTASQALDTALHVCLQELPQLVDGGEAVMQPEQQEIEEEFDLSDIMGEQVGSSLSTQERLKQIEQEEQVMLGLQCTARWSQQSALSIVGQAAELLSYNPRQASCDTEPQPVTPCRSRQNRNTRSSPAARKRKETGPRNTRPMNSDQRLHRSTFSVAI